MQTEQCVDGSVNDGFLDDTLSSWVSMGKVMGELIKTAQQPATRGQHSAYCIHVPLRTSRDPTHLGGHHWTSRRLRGVIKVI
jgi:hypothetical protein